MESSALVQQGIAAYKAGNKEEAVRLLSQALRENRQDEDAWLYLGAAIDDPARKRQAFQQVLQINPANEKAKEALARLDQMAAGGSAAASSSVPPQPEKKKNNRYDEGFAIPLDIDGAPKRVTTPYLIENAQMRINQAIRIYTNRDFEEVVRGAQGATMWDVVFTAGIGVVAMGAAELLGGIIGWPLRGFYGGLGGLIYPFFSAITIMISTAAGFAAGAYASRWYLQNEGINVSMPQHSMYYALVFLPLVLVNAVFSFLSNALGLLILCLAPIFLIVGIAALIYSWFLLKGAFDRVYGTENNRGTITAVVAIAGWVVGSIVAGILTGIIRAIFSPIFRYRF